MTIVNISEVYTLPAFSMNLTVMTVGIALENKTVPAPTLGLAQGSGWGWNSVIIHEVFILPSPRIQPYSHPRPFDPFGTKDTGSKWLSFNPVYRP